MNKLQAIICMPSELHVDTVYESRPQALTNGIAEKS